MSGAFLSDHRQSTNERETERRVAEYYRGLAQKYYRWATGLLIVAMVVIATPQLGLEGWHWHLVAGVVVVMTILAVLMMRYGHVSNGCICLLCAFVVLPGWVYLADDVVKVALSLFEMIVVQFRGKLG